jgi:hypothetical protein
LELDFGAGDGFRELAAEDAYGDGEFVVFGYKNAAGFVDSDRVSDLVFDLEDPTM